MPSRIAPEVPHDWGKERRGWHIDKTISISDLLIALPVVLSGLWWAASVNSRFAVIDEKLVTFEHQRIEDRQATEAKFADLKSQLTRIDDKIDKIADKVGSSK